jgi:hypothetical protein
MGDDAFIAHEVDMRLVFHIIWGRVAPIRRVIETLRLPKNGIAASLMDYARFNYSTTRRQRSSIYSPDGSLRSLR